MIQEGCALFRGALSRCQHWERIGGGEGVGQGDVMQGHKGIKRSSQGRNKVNQGSGDPLEGRRGKVTQGYKDPQRDMAMSRCWSQDPQKDGEGNNEGVKTKIRVINVQGQASIVNS